LAPTVPPAAQIASAPIKSAAKGKPKAAHKRRISEANLHNERDNGDVDEVVEVTELLEVKAKAGRQRIPRTQLARVAARASQRSSRIAQLQPK